MGAATPVAQIAEGDLAALAEGFARALRTLAYCKRRQRLFMNVARMQRSGMRGVLRQRNPGLPPFESAR